MLTCFCLLQLSSLAYTLYSPFSLFLKIYCKSIWLYLAYKRHDITVQWTVFLFLPIVLILTWPVCYFKTRSRSKSTFTRRNGLVVKKWQLLWIRSCQWRGVRWSQKPKACQRSFWTTPIRKFKLINFVTKFLVTKYRNSLLQPNIVDSMNRLLFFFIKSREMIKI